MNLLKCFIKNIQEDIFMKLSFMGSSRDLKECSRVTSVNFQT